MNRYEYAFLVNYLGDRQYKYGIHDSVKQRYPEWESNIKECIQSGDVIMLDEKYVLSDSGEEIRKQFRKYEKERRKRTEDDIVQLCLEKEYLEAYNRKVKYERESIIPHGISIGLGGSRTNIQWEYCDSMPESVRKYIESSQKIDLSFLSNTPVFKQKIRDLYVATYIFGNPRIDLKNINLGEKICSYELFDAFPQMSEVQYLYRIFDIIYWARSCNDSISDVYKYKEEHILQEKYRLELLNGKAKKKKI